MKKLYLLILASMFLYTCENPTSSESSENTSWVFVANEGNYGASNGTVSMIDDQGNLYETESLGDVVQAVEVYEDKLIVLVNNSHMMKIFDPLCGSIYEDVSSSYLRRGIPIHFDLEEIE